MTFDMLFYTDAFYFHHQLELNTIDFTALPIKAKSQYIPSDLLCNFHGLCCRGFRRILEISKHVFQNVFNYSLNSRRTEWMLRFQTVSILIYQLYRMRNEKEKKQREWNDQVMDRISGGRKRGRAGKPLAFLGALVQ